MSGLGPPPASVVERATCETGFSQRLIGVRRALTTGNTAESIYSFEELLTFLQGPRHPEQLLTRGGHDQIPYVDLGDLVAWLRGVMADEELADTVAAEAIADLSYAERLERIRGILQERWQQVQSAVAPVS